MSIQTLTISDTAMNDYGSSVTMDKGWQYQNGVHAQEWYTLTRLSQMHKILWALTPSDNHMVDHRELHNTSVGVTGKINMYCELN